MGVKKFIFAGLDFIFDKEGNPWFLEANGSPRGMLSYGSLYRYNSLSKEIAGYMLKQGKELCVISSSAERYDEKKENSRWVYRRLKMHIPDLRLCYIQQNKNRRKKLLDANGESFRPDCIYKNHFKISSSFERVIPVINPMLVWYMVTDKMITIDIVKKRLPDIRVPKTFYLRDAAELGKILKERKELFKEGYVIKPIDMSFGIGVHVLSSHTRGKIKFRKPKILQQRIVPGLIRGKYWDLRAFLINGRLIGGEMRESVRRVTNLAMGAKAYKAPRKILEKVRKASEEIVHALDQEACEKSESPDYYSYLRKRFSRLR